MKHNKVRSKGKGSAFITRGIGKIFCNFRTIVLLKQAYIRAKKERGGVILNYLFFTNDENSGVICAPWLPFYFSQSLIFRII